MSGFKNKVAAVTGAGSGIGQALAVGLARRGARLAISDVNEQGLAQTIELVKAAGAEVQAAHVDVADRANVAQWAASVAEHWGVVNQIYNNAGIGALPIPIADTDYAAFQRVLDINLWGVIHGTKEFLPHLTASGDGHVVNISSLNGFMAQPGLGAYCTSKFAVRGFTEALRGEMILAGHKVAVTVVHPGGVKTNIGSGIQEPANLDEQTRRQLARRREVYGEKLMTTTAEDAASTILRGVAAKRGRVLIGQATTVDRLVRLLPGPYPRLVALWEKRTFAAARTPHTVRDRP